MSLTIDDDQKTYLWADLTLTADPTGSTVTLEVLLNGVPVSGSPFAMAWQGSPVVVGSTWTQTARTTARFIGSAATIVGSDVKPGAGTFVAQVLVATTDGQVIPATAQRVAIG